ncbi:hypothetical protein D3C87_1516360 [compost metagenome]
MDWPSVGAMCCAMVRAKRSVVPPAGNGTIRVMGRVGQVCADAAAENISVAAATAEVALPAQRPALAAVRH